MCLDMTAKKASAGLALAHALRHRYALTLEMSLQGKVEGDCFIVLDAFALPVEGTETRVNAQQEAYEYIIDFAETNKVRRGLMRLEGC